MQIFLFIFLGIVQGITEPLPISSSGHLLIFETLLNVNLPGVSFEAFVNFGSTIAIFYYFREKILKLILEFIAYIYSFINILSNKDDLVKKKKYKKFTKKFYPTFDYSLKIVIATIPLVILGLILILSGYEEVENLKVVGIALFITAIALYLVSQTNGKKTVNQLTYLNCVIIGCFQAIAVMPGLSRSGMCLVGALLIGLASEEAFEFTFMLYLPASCGALLISVLEITQDKDILALLPEYLLAALMACIFTYLALRLLKNLVIAHKLAYFSVYCILVGGITIVFLA